MNKSGKAPSVYVIDDDEDDFIILCELVLQQWPAMKLKHFDSPTDFIGNLNNSNIPELIVLDINMPKFSGFDVIQILKSKEDWKHVPVVFLSTASDVTQQRKAIEMGAYGYFVKPSTLEQWHTIVEELLMIETLSH